MKSRVIKPGFWLNEELAECDPYARLLYIGLWNYADREGLFEWRESRIKATIFPYDDFDISRYLIQLLDKKFLIKYEIDGNSYGSIPHFKKHQSIHKHEAASTLPKPDVDTCSVITRSVSTHLPCVVSISNSISNNNTNKDTPPKVEPSETKPQQPDEPKSPLILPSKEKSKFFFLTAKEKDRVVARYRAELGELNFKKYLPLALEWAERYYEDHPRKKFKSPTRVLMDWPLSKAKQEMMLDMKLAKEKQR